MGAKKALERQSKAAFVRGLPAALSTKEVVAQAKEAGFTLSENYASQLRPQNGSTAAKRTRGTAKKRRGGKKRGAAPARASKAAFVAKFPETTPATTIVAEARKAGLTMSDKFVRKVRGKGRARTSPAPVAAPVKAPAVRVAPASAAVTGKRRKSRKPVRAVAPANGGRISSPPAAVLGKGVSPYEAQFAAAVVDLGFEQAQAILARVRDRILRAAMA